MSAGAAPLCKTPLTDEQLRLAFRELRRPGAPASVEAMLADPSWRIALLGVARNRARAPSIAAGPRPVTPTHAAPVPPVPAAPNRPAAMWLRYPTFDAKSAAANDRTHEED